MELTPNISTIKAPREKSQLALVPSLGVSFSMDKDMRQISLTQGMYAIVDDEDYEWLMQIKWNAMKSGKTYYAQSWNGEKHLFIHRLVLKAKDTQMVDHINRNGLDNRKSNLRFCTKGQNAQNGGLYKNCKNKYKGARWREKQGKWYSDIKFNYKKIHLGCFDTEIEAALAYNRAAIELFGEFAYQNEL
ncbi:hypothetical protein LCGC14_1579570 [marine sediment metagenome]|uniref:AP2/ERF domain-containing protein n=1 Tax=marine sediment metagenome TaxID=412755 RepID=A0A0F9IHF2_9ZZZZ